MVHDILHPINSAIPFTNIKGWYIQIVFKSAIKSIAKLKVLCINANHRMITKINRRHHRHRHRLPLPLLRTWPLTSIPGTLYMGTDVIVLIIIKEWSIQGVCKLETLNTAKRLAFYTSVNQSVLTILTRTILMFQFLNPPNRLHPLQTFDIHYRVIHVMHFTYIKGKYIPDVC